MRDEKICPTCGGPLVWKGNVLDGALDCAHCAQVDSDYITIDCSSQTVEIGCSVQLTVLKDEEQPTTEEIDSNIKAMNRAAGIKPEYAEWDDLCFKPVNLPTTGEDFQQEYGLGEQCVKEWERAWHGRNRQTGRTTRMVERALKVAAAGKKVIILTHNQSMVRYIEQMIAQRGHEKDRQGRFAITHQLDQPTGSVLVMPVMVTPRCAGRDVEVYADHAIFDDFTPFTAENMDAWRARHEINS